MENSRILKGSLDLTKLKAADRDDAVLNFIELLNYFRTHDVSVHKEKGFDNHEYAYGYAAKLFYLSWKEALSIECFSGISQNVFQMLAPTLMQHPGIGQEIENQKWAELDNFKSNFGLDLYPAPHPGYCINNEEWHIERYSYYQNNQSKYVWKNNNDDFLPNKDYSDSILRAEIEEHSQKDIYKKALDELKHQPLHVQFHKGILSHKGPELAAYTEKIGSKICHANFYRHEKELSKEEQKLAKSQRKIFSMINRKGKSQYISLDFAHGMFEYIDGDGNHLGEYRMTGDRNSGAEADHGLKSDLRKYQ